MFAPSTRRRRRGAFRPCASSAFPARELVGLEEKARFALGEGREDLAEAAIARQLDLEGQAERLRAAETDAGREAARLEEGLTALAGRKAQMEEALATFEAAQREASPQDGACRSSITRSPARNAA